MIREYRCYELPDGSYRAFLEWWTLPGPTGRLVRQIKTHLGDFSSLMLWFHTHYYEMGETPAQLKTDVDGIPALRPLGLA